MPEKIDLAIIGAGPSGLFAVFEAGMLGIKSHVFDILEEVGGQCRALYPNKPIYDIAAHPKILAGELIDNLEKQAEPFNPTYHLCEAVADIKKQTDDTGFLLKTSKNNEFLAKTVIIACGMGGFEPNKPNVDGIEDFEDGKGITYLIKNPQNFKGKRIAIAGGGNSAVDWALILKDIAEEVVVFHRKGLDDFKASADNIEKLKEAQKRNELKLLENYEIKELKGDNKLKKIVLKSTDFQSSGEIKELECDSLVIFFGLKADLSFVKNWGLEMNERNLIPVDRLTMETNIKGTFAIGDIADYEGKHRLIAMEFGEAITAVYSAYEIINPDKKAGRGHSTSIGKSVGIEDGKGSK